MSTKKRSVQNPTIDQQRETDQEDSALDTLLEWDSDWAEKYRKMSTNPWSNGILSLKLIELICIALNSACTNLQPEATRRHIRAALAAGATREEILLTIKCSCLLAIHSCSLGAPILLEEAKAAGVKPAGRGKGEPTPSCDIMRELSQWNDAWDPFFELDPVWTDQFFATAISLYRGGAMSAKDVELLSIAFDASITHMYAPGTRRHIKGALKLGASMEEIMEVLKLCVSFGIEACRMGVPILAEELERFERRG